MKPVFVQEIKEAIRDCYPRFFVDAPIPTKEDIEKLKANLNLSDQVLVCEDREEEEGEEDEEGEEEGQLEGEEGNDEVGISFPFFFFSSFLCDKQFFSCMGRPGTGRRERRRRTKGRMSRRTRKKRRRRTGTTTRRRRARGTKAWRRGSQMEMWPQRTPLDDQSGRRRSDRRIMDIY